MDKEQNEQEIKTVIPKEGLEDNQRKFLKLFGKNLCNVSKTCEAAKIGRTMFYEWLKYNKVFTETILYIRESLIDWVESKLYVAVNENNMTAIIFYLKTQGKKRGWSERFDVDLEKGTTKLFQSPEDKKLITETRKKLALLDLLLVTEDRDKKMKMLEEFKK